MLSPPLIVLRIISSPVGNPISDLPIPRILENGNAICVDADKAGCIVPDIYYFDMPYNNYNFLHVAAVNVKESSKAITSQHYLMESNQNMYVSLNNLKESKKFGG